MPEIRKNNVDMKGRNKIISFDVAGTLLHFARPVSRIYAEAAVRHGIPANDAEIDARLPEAFVQAGAIIDASEADVGGAERRWWRRVLAGALALPMEDERLNSCFPELFDYYASGDAWRMHAGLPDFLAALREAGYRLAICSNFDARLFGLLQQLGISEYFEVVVLPRHARAQKPAAAIFHAVSAAFDVAPAACLHIGDSVENDVVAARLAGLQALQWALKPQADIDQAGGMVWYALRHTTRPVFSTADAWRDTAMARPNGVDPLESARRRATAREHYSRQGTPPSNDLLADHELYILGKMSMDEYQEYLVFKYGQNDLTK